jgi:hypothetical protein
MYNSRATPVLVLSLVFSGIAEAEEPRLPEQRRVLHPFDYRGVTREDGFLKRQVDGDKA